MVTYRLEEDGYESTEMLAAQIEDALDASGGGIPVVSHGRYDGAQVLKS